MRLPWLGDLSIADLANPDGAMGVGSAGLGLAICKGIAEAHGGAIWAERRAFTSTVPSGIASTTRIA